MEQFSSKFLNISFLVKILLVLFLFSIFFPIRHVFFNSFAYKLGQYSDFTSFSLYLSDILLFLLTLATFFPLGRRFHVEKPILFLFLWIIVIFLSHYSTGEWYYLAKWTELIVAYGTFKCLFENFPVKSLFLKTFVVLSSIQALIALGQFLNQSYIGLNKFGEQMLSPNTLGFAKIIINNITFVRGYGTFPHPNLLSAYLSAGILMIIFLLAQETSRIKKLLYSLALFINLLGLVVTFSRAAFLATLIGSLLFFGILALKRQLTQPAKLAIIVFGTCLIVVILLFRPFLISRATVSDSASQERIFYAKAGLQMLRQNPIFGVGIGESIPLMQKYSPLPLAPWQIQPVHNYFLLAATELGIIGALILIWIFFSHLIKLLKQQFTSYNLQLTTILVMFLILMQFDHYFYTLQQTQLLLWIILGIIAAETEKPKPLDWIPATLKALGYQDQKQNPS